MVRRYPIGSTCICGKLHNSWNTYYIHNRNPEKYSKKPNDKTGSGDITTITPTSPHSDSKALPNAVEPVLHLNILKEINLKGEFETMTEKINPKTTKTEEKAYECASCGYKFDEKVKYCPSCGVEFA